MARPISLLLGLLLCLCAAGPVFAQPPDLEALAQQGADAYAQRDFARAVTVWEQVVAAGVHQSQIYYDLARAYEYLGRWGRSRLNDLRAAQGVSDMPSDALDRGWARQGIEALHPLISLKRLSTVTQDTRWHWGGVIMWWGLCAAVIVWLLWRRGRWVLIVLGLGVLLWGSAVVLYTVLERTLVDAVSLDSTPVSSGPGPDYVTLATWDEGFDLWIMETRGDWVRVMRADGLTGWVEHRLIAEVALPNPSS